jgi:hypothetical protein
MSGTIVVDHVLLGDSATPGQNLRLKTNKDGTFSFVREDATPIIEVDAGGRVRLPQNVKTAFSAIRSTAQTISTSTFTTVQLNVEEYDFGGFFNNTAAAVNGIPAWAFMPDVPGIYMVCGGIQYASPIAQSLCSIWKNGVEYRRGAFPSTGYGSTVASLLYLNGVNDYVDLRTWHAAGSNQSLTAVTYANYLNAVLVQGEE